MAEPEQTILFGSRARGDHRPDSDIDVLIIKKHSPTEEWLDDLRERARARCRRRACRKPPAST